MGTRLGGAPLADALSLVEPPGGEFASGGAAADCGDDGGVWLGRRSATQPTSRPSLAALSAGLGGAFGSAGRSLDTLVPEPPRFEGRRFPSVELALADGPKTFEALMAATGTRDGREIVLALEVLRAAGRLSRDREGRYGLN